MAAFAPPVPWNTLPGAAFELVDTLLVELAEPGFLGGATSAATSPGSTSAARTPAKRSSTRCFCGQRWFKFRHLDEVFINGSSSACSGRACHIWCSAIRTSRGSGRGTPPSSEQADHYLNSGAAGRFENLIWGVEIIDGVAQVVAWHRPGGPQSGEAPERRTYTPAWTAQAGPWSRRTSMSRSRPWRRRRDAGTRWLEPVLHVMHP